MSQRKPSGDPDGPPDRDANAALTRLPHGGELPRIGEPRRRILAAMIATVGARGFRATTVARVADAAAVPEAVFHEHFQDTAECFVGALDVVLTSAELMVLRHFNEQAPWEQRVMGALGALLQGMADHPDAAKAAVVESFGAGEAARERYRATMRIFVPLIEEGRGLARHPESLSDQTSHAIVGGIASIVHRRVLEDRTAELPSLLGELGFFALMPFLGHSRAMKVAGLSPS